MKVLVVEDDPKIKKDIIDDVLYSLGYTSDWAAHQQQAVDLLQNNHYDLVLLDLQIPARPNSSRPNAEFGKYLLRQIHDIKGRGNVPVIIMTAYHQNCLDMASDLKDIGAETFITKPFPPEGRTLARVIEETFQKYRQSKTSQLPGPVGTFQGGEMVFFPDRIELCDVKIFGSKTIASREMLKVLAQSYADGKYEYFGGEKLAIKIHAANGIGTITGCARTIRNQTARVLKRHLNVEVGREDILEHNDQGYRLNHRISARFCDNVEHSENSPVVGQNSVQVGHLVGQKNDQPAAKVGHKVKKRCQWILDELAKGRKVTKENVQKEQICSEKTAQRALDLLRNDGRICFQPVPKPGHYRLDCSSKPAIMS